MRDHANLFRVGNDNLTDMRCQHQSLLRRCRPLLGLPQTCKPIASHGDRPKPSTRLTLKGNNLRKRAVNVHANDSRPVAPSLSPKKREPAGNTTHTDPRSQRIRESRKGGQITSSSSQLICQRRPARTSRTPGAPCPGWSHPTQSTKISRTCEAPPALHTGKRLRRKADRIRSDASASSTWLYRGKSIFAGF